MKNTIRFFKIILRRVSLLASSIMNDSNKTRLEVSGSKMNNSSDKVANSETDNYQENSQPSKSGIKTNKKITDSSKHSKPGKKKKKRKPSDSKIDSVETSNEVIDPEVSAFESFGEINKPIQDRHKDDQLTSGTAASTSPYPDSSNLSLSAFSESTEELGNTFELSQNVPKDATMQETISRKDTDVINESILDYNGENFQSNLEKAALKVEGGTDLASAKDVKIETFKIGKNISVPIENLPDIEPNLMSENKEQKLTKSSQKDGSLQDSTVSKKQKKHEKDIPAESKDIQKHNILSSDDHIIEKKKKKKKKFKTNKKDDSDTLNTDSNIKTNGKEKPRLSQSKDIQKNSSDKLGIRNSKNKSLAKTETSKSDISSSLDTDTKDKKKKKKKKKTKSKEIVNESETSSTDLFTKSNETGTLSSSSFSDSDGTQKNKNESLNKIETTQTEVSSSSDMDTKDKKKKKTKKKDKKVKDMGTDDRYSSNTRNSIEDDEKRKLVLLDSKAIQVDDGSKFDVARPSSKSREKDKKEMKNKKTSTPEVTKESRSKLDLSETSTSDVSKRNKGSNPLPSKVDGTNQTTIGSESESSLSSKDVTKVVNDDFKLVEKPNHISPVESMQERPLFDALFANYQENLNKDLSTLNLTEMAKLRAICASVHCRICDSLFDKCCNCGSLMNKDRMPIISVKMSRPLPRGFCNEGKEKKCRTTTFCKPRVTWKCKNVPIEPSSYSESWSLPYNCFVEDSFRQRSPQMKTVYMH